MLCTKERPEPLIYINCYVFINSISTPSIQTDGQISNKFPEFEIIKKWKFFLGFPSFPWAKKFFQVFPKL